MLGDGERRLVDHDPRELAWFEAEVVAHDLVLRPQDHARRVRPRSGRTSSIRQGSRALRSGFSTRTQSSSEMNANDISPQSTFSHGSSM